MIYTISNDDERFTHDVRNVLGIIIGPLGEIRISRFSVSYGDCDNLSLKIQLFGLMVSRIYTS